MPEAFLGLVEREVARRGGGESELFVSRERVRRYDARCGGIDSLSFSDAVSIGVRFYRDGRSGFSYGFRESGDEAVRMVEEAISTPSTRTRTMPAGYPARAGNIPRLRSTIPHGRKSETGKRRSSPSVWSGRPFRWTRG